MPTPIVAARLCAVSAFSLLGTCAVRPAEQPVTNAAPEPRATHQPRLTLHAAAMELRAAVRGRGDLSPIVSDADRPVHVIFHCVDPMPVAPGANMDREHLLLELDHVRVSDHLSCDEATRCCSFVREPGTPKMQATIGKACFGADVQLESLTLVHEDACRG